MDYEWKDIFAPSERDDDDFGFMIDRGIRSKADRKKLLEEAENIRDQDQSELADVNWNESDAESE